LGITKHPEACRRWNVAIRSSFAAMAWLQVEYGP
jgi:hypothetical protein